VTSCRAASCLVLLLAVTGPNASRASAERGAAVDPSGLGLSDEARAHLSAAAADPALEPWKRDVMLGIARAPRAGVQQTTTADGSWKSFCPEQRMDASAIYDPVRKRMIVFGGKSDQWYRNDTWALTLTGSPTWSPLATTGTPPIGRTAPSAIYDATRDRMVIFGGYDGTNRYHDVWALALSGAMAWTDITPPGGILSGPTPRYYHTAIYDPVRDRMLVLGGYDSFYEGDVWALSFSANTWTQLAPAGTGPVALVNHTSIYDPVRDRMLTFGGFDGTHRSDTTWVMTLAGTPTWSRLSPSGTPPLGLTGARGAYDPVRDRLVVSGGYDGSYENAEWALSLSGSPAWNTIVASGAPPTGRASHDAIYDPNGDRMVVFDGTDGPNGLVYHLLDDTWSLTLGGSPAWSELPPGPNVPARRVYSSAIVDPVRKRMVIYGGHDGTDLGNPNYFGDVAAWSIGASPAWSVITPSGTPPVARAGHTAIYDPLRNRMLVFGGIGNLSGFNDVWALSLGATPAWTLITPSGTPPSARFFHSAVYDFKRDRMLVFGGRFGISYYNEVWALSLSGTPAWTLLTPTGTPPAGRAFHAAIYDPVRDRMLVYGGLGEFQATLADAWALNLASNPAWVPITTVGSAFLVSSYSGVYDPVRDRMLLFGGYNTTLSLSYVDALSLSGTPTWSSPAPTGDPSPERYYQTTVYDAVNDQLLIFGGQGYVQRHDVWSLYWGTPLLDATPAPPVTKLSLAAPWPNPSRGTSAIEFELPTATRVRLAIFDVGGREVRRIEDTWFAPGRYSRSWDGVDVAGKVAPSGVYFVRLETPGASLHAKLIRLR
jgi:hypothetical protein